MGREQPDPWGRRHQAGSAAPTSCFYKAKLHGHACFVFDSGLHLAVLRNHFWQGMWDHVGCRRGNLNQLPLRQAPTLLSFGSGPTCGAPSLQNSLLGTGLRIAPEHRWLWSNTPPHPPQKKRTQCNVLNNEVLLTKPVKM